MPRFSESDLTFVFPPSYWVQAFDDHRFYQALSGHGLKAVDFLVIPPEGPIRFVEVKNYRPRTDASGVPYPVVLPPPESLVEQLQHKLAHSHRILHIVHRYYRRHWTHRLRIRLGRLLPRRWWRGDLLYWYSAYERMQTSGSVAVLYLALADGIARERSALVPIDMPADVGKGTPAKTISSTRSMAVKALEKESLDFRRSVTSLLMADHNPWIIKNV